MDIYDVSKKSGFSIATVSRVINGSEKVSEKTRAKVLEAIAECGYTPNAFARGLGLNTMKTVGIMCADCSDPYLARAVYFTERHLRKEGYDVLLSCTGFEREVKAKCMEMLLSRRVDAVILTGSNYIEPDDKGNDYIKNAAKSVPVMIINGYLDADGVYSEVCDDQTALYDVTLKMLRSGRKKPLYVYKSRTYSAMRKLGGYKSALLENGFSGKDILTLFIGGTGSAHSSRDAIKAFSETHPDIDCIMAEDDLLAVGALKYAREEGLSVPRDIAVAGYNNSSIVECCEPELTSVDNHLEALCKNCVSSLMEIFADRKDLVPKKTVFSCDLAERGTTNFSDGEA